LPKSHKTTQKHLNNTLVLFFLSFFLFHQPSYYSTDYTDFCQAPAITYSLDNSAYIDSGEE